VKAEEPARARQYLERALKLDPTCLEAMLGQAEALLLERNHTAAEDWVRRALSTNPPDKKVVSSSHALLARVRLETGDRVQAEAEASKAIEADPGNAHALYIMAFIRAAQRKPTQVRSLAQRALEIDPYLAGARRLLSQYLNGSSGYSQKVDVAAFHHFEIGKGLEGQGRVKEAVSEYEAAASAQPGYYRALIALASLELMQRQYGRAIVDASRALEVDPEGAIANMEVAYAQIGIAEQSRTEIGATDYSIRFYEDGVHPVKSSLLRLVFPDYDKLADKGRIVLGKSVAGLACFLPSLVSVSARHYLLRLDQSVSECAGFKELRDRTTFDGRYYASIRGVGGRVALSGVEYLDEASQGGFNAIAHEFAHQVHETAMGPEQLSAIRRLYETAVKEGRALDYYAAANEFEYFAVGYEAFVSSFKRPGATLTARHTRDELRARDPGLFSLLTKMADKSAQAGTD
jgi:Tfp pilus assembly protein PilF